MTKQDLLPKVPHTSIPQSLKNMLIIYGYIYQLLLLLLLFSKELF